MPAQVFSSDKRIAEFRYYDNNRKRNTVTKYCPPPTRMQAANVDNTRKKQA